MEFHFLELRVSPFEGKSERLIEGPHRTRALGHRVHRLSIDLQLYRGLRENTAFVALHHNAVTLHYEKRR